MCGDDLEVIMLNVLEFIESSVVVECFFFVVIWFYSLYFFVVGGLEWIK